VPWHDLRVLVVEILVAVAVLVAVAFIASRTDIGGIDDPDTDHADIGLPNGRLLRSNDIGQLRFRAVSGWRGTVRGYRFGDVDATMSKVEETLRSHEQARDERR
jgi:hypothetical protein